MNTRETLTTAELLRARALLDSPDARIRAAYVLGTRVGRQQAMDGLDAYTTHNVERFLSESLGTPPWVEQPIAGHDYPLTDAQRVAMFPPLATAA